MGRHFNSKYFFRIFGVSSLSFIVVLKIKKRTYTCCSEAPILRVRIEYSNLFCRWIFCLEKKNIKFEHKYSWGAGKVRSEYSTWFRQLQCISWKFLTMSRLSKSLYHVRSCKRCPVQICVQIGLKMEAGSCPPLNMNAMHNYLLGQSLRRCKITSYITKGNKDFIVESSNYF